MSTQDERLTQLADLYRQGILSDEDYEAATARLQQASPVVDEQTAPAPRAGNPTSSFGGLAAASHLAMLLIAVNVVIGIRAIDAFRDERLLGGVTYPWAFFVCAGLWLVAVLLLRGPQDEVARRIVVGIAILTAMVIVAGLGTDSLPLLLNTFVLVAVGLDSGRAESP